MKLSCEAEEHCRRELGNMVVFFFFSVIITTGKGRVQIRYWNNAFGKFWLAA